MDISKYMTKARVQTLRRFFIIVVSTTIVYFTLVHVSAAQTVDYQLDVPYYIDAISWSPDGQLIAVSGSDGVFIYTDSLQELDHLQKNATNYSTSFTWKPDSTQLASIGNGSIWIWDRSQNDTFTLNTTLHIEDY